MVSPYPRASSAEERRIRIQASDLDEGDLMDTADDSISIGISSCLLGHPVRFDGGHKRDRFIDDTLSRFVRFVPVCPEMDLGLGTPRETLRLARDESDDVGLIGAKSGDDLSRKMNRYAAGKVRSLAKLDLSGYILKSASPSCGMERVRVYDRNGSPTKNGTGLFARALMERLPLLPVEEEGRLNDPRLRENFFERIFAYRRLRSLFAGRWTIGQLVRFHTTEKMLMLAHDRAHYKALGQLVANAKAAPRAELVADYSAHFMKGLKKTFRPRSPESP